MPVGTLLQLVDDLVGGDQAGASHAELLHHPDRGLVLWVGARGDLDETELDERDLESVAASGAPTDEAISRRLPFTIDSHSRRQEVSMSKRVVQVDGVLQYEQFGFTNCVRHGDVLWLSGISALDADGHVLAEDIESQTRYTFENIDRVLRAGGSSLSDLLQMTSFVVDMPKNGQGYVDTRKKVLPEPTYTSATIGVSALMIPGLLLEVQCRAAAGA